MTSKTARLNAFTLRGVRWLQVAGSVAAVTTAAAILACASLSSANAQATKTNLPSGADTGAWKGNGISYPFIPSAEEIEREAQFHSLVALGDASVKEKKWSQASDDYQKAFAVSPDPRVLYKLAQCAAEQGDKAGQIRWYRKAIYAPNPPIQGRDYKSNFMEVDPNRQMEFAVLLSEAGETDEAYYVYCHAMDYINRPERHNSGYVLPLPTREDYEAHPVQNTPNHIEAMALTALSDDGQNRLKPKEERLRMLQKAVKLAPSSPIPYFYLGDLLYQFFSDNKGAKKAYLKAKQYDYAKHAGVIADRLRVVQ